MPTYQTLLPTSIYSFLDSMAQLYSQIELQMHVALISGEKISTRYGQEFIDIALRTTKHKRGKEYRNGTEKPVTHRFVKRERKWYLHTTVELPDIPTISNRKWGNRN